MLNLILENKPVNVKFVVPMTPSSIFSEKFYPSVVSIPHVGSYKSGTNFHSQRPQEVEKY